MTSNELDTRLRLIDFETSLALAGYILFCCAYGALTGSMKGWAMGGSVDALQTLFSAGLWMWWAGLVCIFAENYQAPTRIWEWLRAPGAAHA